MPTIRIDKDLKDRCYFVTFTVIDIIDIFTSSIYFETLINALGFYQKKLNYIHENPVVKGYVDK